MECNEEIEVEEEALEGERSHALAQFLQAVAHNKPIERRGLFAGMVAAAAVGGIAATSATLVVGNLLTKQQGTSSEILPAYPSDNANRSEIVGLLQGLGFQEVPLRRLQTGISLAPSAVTVQHIEDQFMRTIGDFVLNAKRAVYQSVFPTNQHHQQASNQIPGGVYVPEFGCLAVAAPEQLGLKPLAYTVAMVTNRPQDIQSLLVASSTQATLTFQQSDNALMLYLAVSPEENLQAIGTVPQQFFFPLRQ